MALNESGVDAQLAIETSGHAAFKENYFLDDGAYVIAKILMLLPRLKEEQLTLEAIIQGLRQPVEVQEIRLGLTKRNHSALVRCIKKISGNEITARKSRRHSL